MRPQRARRILAAVDEPDAFEKTRLILARARRQGQPFEVIWPKAVDAATPAVDRQRHISQAVRDRDADRRALESAEEAWRAGYERRALPRRATPRPITASRCLVDGHEVLAVELAVRASERSS